MNTYFEDDKTELKRELTDEVKSEILAFLNSDGGTIYLGVGDDGVVYGFDDVKDKDSLDLKVGNWLDNSFFPRPSNLVKHYFNDDNVLTIQISKGTHKRISVAQQEIESGKVYKYHIVNDDLDKSIEKVIDIIKKEMDE